MPDLPFTKGLRSPVEKAPSFAVLEETLKDASVAQRKALRLKFARRPRRTPSTKPFGPSDCNLLLWLQRSPSKAFMEMSAFQDKPLAVSYIFFLLIFVAVGVLQLTTVFGLPFLFALPGALRALSFGKNKWTAVVLFVILLATLFYGFAFFVNQAIIALPEMASKAIPVIVRYATERGSSCRSRISRA